MSHDFLKMEVCTVAKKKKLHSQTKPVIPVHCWLHEKFLLTEWLE